MKLPGPEIGRTEPPSAYSSGTSESEVAILRKSDTKRHPLALEAWQGYARVGRVELTLEQAHQLSTLLKEAVDAAGYKPGAKRRFDSTQAELATTLKLARPKLPPKK